MDKNEYNPKDAIQGVHDEEYMILLGATSPDGLTNQVVQITKSKTIQVDTYCDEIICVGNPMSNDMDIIVDYKYVTCNDPIKFSAITYKHEKDVDVIEMENVKNEMYSLQMSQIEKWNQFVHENYSIELNIFSGENKVATVCTKPLCSLEVKKTPQYYGGIKLETEYLVLPENEFGLKGLFFHKQKELYTIFSIFVDKSKYLLYKKIYPARDFFDRRSQNDE